LRRSRTERWLRDDSSPCRSSSTAPLFLVLVLSLAVWLSLAPLASASPDDPAAPAEAPPVVADSNSSSSSDSSNSRSGTKPVPNSPPPPIGVRLAESLEGNRLRLAYSFEQLRYRELLSGSRDRTSSQARNEYNPPYEQTPKALDVSVHTFELAYAPHPRLTLVLEVPFLEKELRRIDAAGRSRRDRSDGVGDIRFSIIIPFIRKGRETSQIHLGFDAPTGSIRRGGDQGRLPYDNQIGNGSWDLEWGWTYRGELDYFSWGAQLLGNHPVDTNGLHYREGSRFEASMWSGLRIVSGLSASLRFSVEKRNNIHGRDRNLDIVADGPSSNDKKRGGFHFDVYPGIALEIPGLDRQRLAVEFGLPIYQNLDGPQLSRDWSVKAGWQWVY
jgi:hypothetical protein